MMESGIVPESLFCGIDKSIKVIFDFVMKIFGIDPCRSLYPKLIDSSFEEANCGRVPLMRYDDKSIRIKFGKAATERGMVPKSLLFAISITFREDRVPISGGMVPEKFVSDRRIAVITKFLSHSMPSHSHAVPNG